MLVLSILERAACDPKQSFDMSVENQKLLGKIELTVGGLMFLVVIGLLLASAYYQDIWPHKSHALFVFSGYPALAAVTLSFAGLLLIKQWELRLAMQPVLVIYGLSGIIVMAAVLFEVYLT